MNALWNTLIVLLLSLALALGVLAAPPATQQRDVMIHPFETENIEKTDAGYLIRDNESGEVFLFDESTALTPKSEDSLPGWNPDDAPLEWFERYLNAPLESGLAFGVGDIFDAAVTGDHIDALRGVYWWD